MLLGVKQYDRVWVFAFNEHMRGTIIRIKASYYLVEVFMEDRFYTIARERDEIGQ